MATDNHTVIATGAAANASVINAPLGQLDAAMGDVSALTTSANTLTGAINEHDGELGNIASLTIGNNNVATAINALDAQDGNLTSLTTSAKSTLVAAINEVQSELNTEITARGAGDDTLDARIDNLIFESETSSSETVDARSAGNVGSAAATLSARLEWLEGATTVYAAAYGFDDGATAANNLTALNAAIDAAVALAEPTVVMLPAGRFACNSVTVDEGVVLRGARMPYHDRTAGTLAGGTILDGPTVTLSSGSGLMDLGIEKLADGTGNAITAGGSVAPLIINVAVLGNKATETNVTAHGFVSASGSRTLISNLYVAETTHGVIFKGSHNQIFGLTTWNVGTIVGLYGDGGQDCTYNLISDIKADGTAKGDGGAIWLNAFGGNSVNANTISNINIHNGTYAVVLKYTESGSCDCKYNVIGPGLADTLDNAGVTIEETSDDTSPGTGCDYNIITGMIIKDADTYSFANNWATGAVGNIITGCISYSPGSGHVTGPFAQYGVNQQSGLIAKLTKTGVQEISTGTSGWSAVTWEAEGGPFSILDPEAADPSQFGNVPYSGAMYRISAYIEFEANATGARYVRIARDTSAPYATFAGLHQAISSGISSAQEQSVTLEYISSLNAGYRFKIEVMQDSGGGLDVTANSFVVVQAMK